MTPVRVRGLHGVARDAEAVLVLEALAGGGALAFRIPPGEAARVARVLGQAGCRRVPIYELVRAPSRTALGGRVSGAVLDARPGGIAAEDSGRRARRREDHDAGVPMPPGRRDRARASAPRRRSHATGRGSPRRPRCTRPAPGRTARGPRGLARAGAARGLRVAFTPVATPRT